MLTAIRNWFLREPGLRDHIDRRPPLTFYKRETTWQAVKKLQPGKSGTVTKFQKVNR